MKDPSQLLKKIESIASLDPVRLDIGRPIVSDHGYGGYVPGDDGKRHLQDYWRVLRKYLWMIVGISALVTILVAIYEARQPSVYQARARVQVDLEDNSGYGTASKSNAIFLGTASDPIYFNTQLQTLTSSDLLRRVIRTVDLEHDPAFFRTHQDKRPLVEGLLEIVGLGSAAKRDGALTQTKEVPLSKTIAPATSRDDLMETSELEGYVGALMAGLNVEPVKESRSLIKETRLIDIKFNHLDPLLAAKIANTVADVYVRSNLEKKSLRSVDAGDFLHKRIEELQGEIRRREEQLIAYAKTNKIISLDPNQNTVIERLTGLNRQLLEAENGRKTAEAAYRAALEPGAADALAERDAGHLAEAERKLDDLKLQRSRLLVENTEKWPEVREIDKQIAELQKQIADNRTKSVKTLTTNLETQYRQALAKETSLRAAFDEQRGETTAQNEAAINYRIIQQEIGTYKELLDGLLQRSKENEVLLAGIANNVSVVDYATVPKVPIGPKRLQNVELAFVVSLVFGACLAFLLNSLDAGLHSSEDVERSLGLPALALVPTIKPPRHRHLLSGKPVLALLPSANGNGDSPELLFNMEPGNSVAESFRQLRTTVSFSEPGSAPKILLVTSSTPGEGKTATAINTAVILAHTGASVVLVDADMRHPRLHGLFDLENERGLSTVLSEGTSEEEIMSLVQRHEASGIQVLTAGPTPANPAELLGSEQMPRLISALSTKFEYVVLDSPPVSFFTDSVLLSSLVDGVLLVVHAKRTSPEIVRRSRRILRDTGAKILGVVLNHARTPQKDYYYNYYKA